MFETDVLSTEERVNARNYLNVPNNVPVFSIPKSKMKPHLLGKRGGHYTKGGTKIRHIGAYRRKSWSNIVYRRATLRVVVGELWRPE